MRTWYWLDTGWGCGGVVVDEDGRIVETAPIFCRFRGQKLPKYTGYKLVRLKEVHGSA